MLGGKLIATGSDSCVFKPNIPCKKGTKKSSKKVSKIIYHHDSKNAINKEKKKIK